MTDKRAQFEAWYEGHCSPVAARLYSLKVWGRD